MDKVTMDKVTMNKVTMDKVNIRRATMSDLLQETPCYNHVGQISIAKNQEHFGNRKRIKP